MRIEVPTAVPRRRPIRQRTPRPDTFSHRACPPVPTPSLTAAAIPEPQVESTIRAMVLYESFRPEVPKGKAGWGQAGMLRLEKVLELKEGLLREASPSDGATPKDGGKGASS